MSKEQTFRSEDNAFCLREGSVFTGMRNDAKQIEWVAKRPKGL
jgi:hypothetical protein